METRYNVGEEKRSKRKHTGIGLGLAVSLGHIPLPVIKKTQKVPRV